jgi:hypothetical protein
MFALMLGPTITKDEEVQMPDRCTFSADIKHQQMKSAWHEALSKRKLSL